MDKGSEEKTYYTYRITSDDSDKYYFGVSHVKIENATVEDCLRDGYFGSGGNHKDNKFKRWKKKHRSNLRKEIISLFITKEDAYLHEKALVDHLWKEDPLCLNSCPGGINSGPPARQERTLKHCDSHGDTLHIGESCYRCASAVVTMEKCPKHGEVKHQGDACCPCRSERKNTVKLCERHGEIVFQWDECAACRDEHLYEESWCERHREYTMHRKNECLRCIALTSVHEDFCSKHGLSMFQGDSCYGCRADKSKKRGTCLNGHGEDVSLVGGRCRKCVRAEAYSIRPCSRHGEVKHLKDKCCSCSSELAVHKRDHGAVRKVGCSHCQLVSTEEVNSDF